MWVVGGRLSSTRRSACRGWVHDLKLFVYSRWDLETGKSVAFGEGPGFPAFGSVLGLLVGVLDKTERPSQEGGHLASGYGLVGTVSERVGCASCGYPR